MVYSGRVFPVDCMALRVYIFSMPSSSDPIQDILGQDGILARSLKDFEYRPSQTEMARRIQEAAETKAPAIIEAGTGTGKTLGYLVPLYLSGKKAVISTGTKNLQEQIFTKDIPLLGDATGRKIDAMLMKGRKNYLCLHKYHQFFSQASLLAPDLEMARQKLEQWRKHTVFADRGELPWMRDDDPLWDALSSTSDQCLGSDCLHWEDCYLAALRQRAAQARIIIVNHHLFFADLMVKRSGFGEIIPRFQVVVFDEAHKIEDIATTYFGRRLSSHQLFELTQDAEKETKAFTGSQQKDLQHHLDLVRTGTAHLLDALGTGDERGQLDQETFQRLAFEPARMIRRGLRFLHEKTETRSFRSTSLQAVAARAESLDRTLEEILTLQDANWLRWYERRKRGVTLHASPLEIAENMREMLYANLKTLVFTSATLSTNGNFDYFRSRLGLSDPVIEGIFPSHFDFEKQTLMYVPRDLPLPNAPLFGTRIAERITEILKITSGRALVLFTSYHNLNLVHRLLKGKIPYRIFKQGDAPKSVILERFKRDTHSVLLATGSFWQGVDVPGEALSCLIIDKLPFDSPGDPLVGARIESIRDGSGNPFMDYQLPSAIISLKQGLGRLIRNSSDRGVLSVLDIRMVNSRYGRHFFKSLPAIPLSHDLADVQALFESVPKESLESRSVISGQDA